MGIDERLGQRIKELREKKHISRKELAEQLGVTTQIVTNLELNRKRLDADMLMVLSEVFEMTTDEILGNNPELMTREQALRETDPKNIIERYYVLSEDSQNRVDDMIVEYQRIDKEKRQLESEKKITEPLLAAAHGSDGMSKEELSKLLLEIQKQINDGEFD